MPCLGGGPRSDYEHATVHGSGGAGHAGLRMRGGGGRCGVGPGSLCERKDVQARFDCRPSAPRPLPVPALLCWPAPHQITGLNSAANTQLL